MVAPSAPDPAPHRRREVAESFGAEADRYDRARPRYPHALVAAVMEGLPGSAILDVGIGTGIAASAFREVGAEVLGVEVDPRMAELAEARGFDVEVARFEEWEPRGRDFDAVIAGQTWHWIDPLAGARKAARVLRPGGRLALFWNVGDVEPDLAAAFAAVYRSVDTGLPFTPWAVPLQESYDTMAARAIEGIDEAAAFGTPSRLRFDWQTTMSRDAWLDQVPTIGGHSRIPHDRLADLLSGLGRVVDDRGGSFTMQYATIAVVADRTTA